jgi:phage gp46-like protein
MTDARLKTYASLEGVTMDLLMRDTGLLDDREELATAARVALGTDRLADESDVLPDPDSTDRRGWWGDFEAEEIWGGWPIGTKNWLLTRAKITQAPAMEGSTLERAKRYTLEALQPFVDKRIASQISAVATRATDLQTIEVDAQIFRGPLVDIDLRYQLLWQEEPAFDELPLASPDIHSIDVPSVNLYLYSQIGNHTINVPSSNLYLSSQLPQLRVSIGLDFSDANQSGLIAILGHGV